MGITSYLIKDRQIVKSASVENYQSYPHFIHSFSTEHDEFVSIHRLASHLQTIFTTNPINMKLTINREKLNRGLQIVSKIITNRQSLPILGNILLVTENNLLKISATDLELGILAQIPAEISEQGSFTLPARIFSEFIFSNTDQQISIEVDQTANNTAEVRSDKFKAKISGLPADEFPAIPQIDGNLEITINADVLIKSLKQVVVACALDDIRPALAGIYCKFAGKKLTLAATDSFRLSEKIIDLDLEVPTKELILPSRTAHEIIRTASLLSEENTIKLFASENQIRIQIGPIDIITRLIEGSFPAYEKIIPAETVVDLVVSNNELLSALKVSRIFAVSGSNNIRLTIEEGVIKISSLATERGQSETEITAEITNHSEEKNHQIAYNAKYLADAISIIEEDKIVLFTAGPKKPTIIRNPSDPNFQHLVMPVDIKE